MQKAVKHHPSQQDNSPRYNHVATAIDIAPNYHTQKKKKRERNLYRKLSIAKPGNFNKQNLKTNCDTSKN